MLFNGNNVCTKKVVYKDKLATCPSKLDSFTLVSSRHGTSVYLFFFKFSGSLQITHAKTYHSIAIHSHNILNLQLKSLVLQLVFGNKNQMGPYLAD